MKISLIRFLFLFFRYPSLKSYMTSLARTRRWSDTGGDDAVETLVDSAMKEYQRERFLHSFSEGPGSTPYDEVTYPVVDTVSLR